MKNKISAGEKVRLQAEKAEAKARIERAKTEIAHVKAQRSAIKAAANIQASYRGAVQTRTSSNWTRSTSGTGVVKLDKFNAQKLRDRSRQLEQENYLAVMALDRSVEATIGSTGFQLQCMTDSADWNQRAEDAMNEWFPSADFNGLSWVEHQRFIQRAKLRDGDVFPLLLKIGQIQIIEADYITSEKYTGVGYDGIVLDKFGNPASYTIRTGDWKKPEYKNVRAADILPLIRRNSPNELRGTPIFTTIFTVLEQFMSYVEAVSMAQRVAACFAVIIKTQSPNALSGLPYGVNSNGEDQKEWTLEPAMVQRLGVDETIEQLKPEQPSTNFDSNMRMYLRLIGAALGFPLEQFFLDYSQGNFSAQKAAIRQARRSFDSERKSFVDNYLSRVYRWKISKLINEGKLPDHPQKFKHRWIGEPWAFIDPIEEIQAQQLAVDANLATETENLLAIGKDPAAHYKKRAEEIALKQTYKIPEYHSNFSMELGTQTASPSPDPASSNLKKGKNEDIEDQVEQP